MAERLRFEDEDRLVAVAATWSGVDYLLLALVDEDGGERQVLRRNLAAGAAPDVVVDLPAALRGDEPQRGRLYAMERGGRRLGKTTVRLLPEEPDSACVPAEPQPVLDPAPPAQGRDALLAEFIGLLEMERETAADLGADLGDCERRLARVEEEAARLRGQLADAEADLIRRTSDLQRTRRHAARLEREIAEAVEVLESLADA